jgi:hypothetical protein
MLRLEIKRDAAGAPYPHMAARVLDRLCDAALGSRTIVSAFHTDDLAAFAGLTNIAWLIDTRTAANNSPNVLADRARVLAIPTLGFRWSSIDVAGVATLREAGIALCCFGCNDAGSIEHALEMKPAEISTDRPDLVLQRMNRVATRTPFDSD